MTSPERFDDLAKRVATGTSRRSLLRALAGTVAGGAFSIIGLGVPSASHARASLRDIQPLATQEESPPIQPVEGSEVVQDEPASRSSTTVAYFALGDSNASGHGLMDDGTPCHRSHRAYPYLVATQLEQQLGVPVHFPSDHFLACSGATALEPSPERLKEQPAKWLRNQVDQVIDLLERRGGAQEIIPPDMPVLVTITIGANDLDWLDLEFLAVRMWGVSAEGFLQWVNVTKANVKAAVRQEVERLLAYPNVAIVLTQVHNPINTVSRFFQLRGRNVRCNEVGTLDCYDRTEYAVQGINDGLWELWDVDLRPVKPERLRVVTGLQAAFDAHKAPMPMCGNGPPGVNETWIQYPGLPSVNSELPEGLREAGEGPGDCVHPNDKGAAQYATLVLKRVREVLEALPFPAGAALPPAFVGRWMGEGTETVPPLTWPIVIELHDGETGQVVGTVEYPPGACRGQLTLQRVDSSQVIEITEDITVGEDTCVDGGTFVLTNLGDGSLHFHWSHPAHETVAEGVVVRDALNAPITCRDGLVDCYGDCVDINTDVRHCGGCAGNGGRACNEGLICADGGCRGARACGQAGDYCEDFWICCSAMADGTGGCCNNVCCSAGESCVDGACQSPNETWCATGDCDSCRQDSYSVCGDRCEGWALFDGGCVCIQFMSGMDCRDGNIGCTSSAECGPGATCVLPGCDEASGLGRCRLVCDSAPVETSISDVCSDGQLSCQGVCVDPIARVGEQTSCASDADCCDGEVCMFNGLCAIACQTNDDCNRLGLVGFYCQTQYDPPFCDPFVL